MRFGEETQTLIGDNYKAVRDRYNLKGTLIKFQLNKDEKLEII